VRRLARLITCLITNGAFCYSVYSACAAMVHQQGNEGSGTSLCCDSARTPKMSDPALIMILRRHQLQRMRQQGYLLLVAVRCRVFDLDAAHAWIKVSTSL